jgi:DNA-binding GntR family transcriptional regulator
MSLPVCLAIAGLVGMISKIGLNRASRPLLVQTASVGPSFEESLKAGDIDRHVAAIETFRSRVTQAARNPVLSDMIERIYDRTRITIRRVALLPGRAAAGILQYRAVLAAIMRGDADEAELRIRELNRDARAYIERYKDYVI